jgi:hypothetical protein
MITWNYRVFRDDTGDYFIREVFYADDGGILGCTANAVEPVGSTLDELSHSIDDFKAALALPVLTLDDMPAATTTLDQRLREPRFSAADARRQLGLDEAANPVRSSSRTRKAS